MMHTQMGFHAAIFCLLPVFFGLPSHALLAYHLERGRMPLHDAVGANLKGHNY